jgi:hypothetical protein
MNNEQRAGLTSAGYDLKRGYINRRDGEMYWLKVVARPDAGGEESTVYCLKNAVHYFEGTEAQFKLCFET